MGDVGNIVQHERTDTVEEGTGIGTLAVETGELEDVVEPLSQFHEWGLGQLVELTDKRLREQVVELGDVGKEHIVVVGTTQHLPLPCLHQVGPYEMVGGVGE